MALSTASVEIIRANAPNQNLAAMPPSNPDPFAAEHIAALARELVEKGPVIDPFLADDPDCPVFGLNLACAYPFPGYIASAYNTLAGQIAALDPAVYVYPLWETHITIATFVNFTQHQRRSESELANLKSLVPRITGALRPLTVDPFILELRPPVLTRKAAFIPISDPAGAIARIRAQILQLIGLDAALQTDLKLHGLTVPGIIHATILRFKALPRNTLQFVNQFQTIAGNAALGQIKIEQILLTEEPRPYMRQGEILWRREAPGSPL
jgi:hypothetical protein